MVAVRGSILKLCYLLSHGHVGACALRLLLAHGQIEGFGNCCASVGLCLTTKQKVEKLGGALIQLYVHLQKVVQMFHYCVAIS